MRRSQTFEPLQSAKIWRQATDAPIQATLDELDAIKLHLATIEELLTTLFGPIYSREPKSVQARAAIAEIVERHFDEICSEWEEAISSTFGRKPISGSPSRRTDMANSLTRFIAHMVDPDDIQTYIHLKRHCQEGMLSRAEPSQFNTIHIALKQVILKYVRQDPGPHDPDILRDVVVAAVDERRLMVSWFYIESRESELRASEEKHRNAINHAPDPIYEIDPETFVVQAANSAAEKMHRMIPVKDNLPVVGRPLVDLLPPEVREHTLQHLAAVVQNGADQIYDVSLGPFFIDVNTALVTYGSKQFIHMILHDVTHRHEIMEELLKAERLAAAGTFAAGIAHEVNNPLASISSLVQSLLPGESDSSHRTMLHTILSQITRISGTLKDLVNFARPSIGQRKAVDINHLITETLRLVSYNKRFGGIKIEPLLAENVSRVYADDNEIQQVVLNLLFNAADATQQEGGTITIETRNQPPLNGEKRGRVTLRFADNGIGIPKEHLKRVFDPFFTTKPAGSGVGLGLSLTQRIILANKGTLRIESEIGKGTAVSISLPVADEPPPASHAVTQ